MKKMLLIGMVAALAGAPALEVRADSGWATAGKILTGVVIGSALTYACTAPPPPVVYVPPAPVVVAAPPVIVQTYPAYVAPPVVVQPAPVCVVPRPVVVVRPARVVCPPPVVIHHPHGYALHRHHCR